MKTKSLKLVVSFIIVMIASCDEPETVVTDIVHPDGSITRRIEMKNFQNRFKISDIQVPFDTTWTVRDSIELLIDENRAEKDTIWVKRAEKLFSGVDELNKAYLSDSGSNREASRRAEFKRTFKWFNTVYRFSEIIDKRLSDNYPLSDILNEEEMKWFFTPDPLNEKLKEGPDSLKYRALEDTINKKTDHWIMKCMASEWSTEFARLVEKRAGSELSKESLKAREDELVKLIESKGDDLDSLWNNGIFMREFLGETNGKRFQTEADSAVSIVTEKIFFNFNDYNMKIVMPGKTIGSNGFADSTGVMLWPVKSDFFITEPYVMWAESKTPNKWTWVVTGFFLLFVLGGVIYRAVRK